MSDKSSLQDLLEVQQYFGLPSAALWAELAELDEALKDAKKAARLAPTLPEKLERQRAARALETRREGAWRAYDQASREIDVQKDAPLFVLRWRLV